MNLREIEQRAERATKGPWHHVMSKEDALRPTSGIVSHSFHGRWDSNTSSMEVDGHICECDIVVDADFIAHTREDVPALVAAVRELREFIKDSLKCDFPDLNRARDLLEKYGE